MVENPWSRLPSDAPFVLPQDRSIVERFNERYGHDCAVAIQTQLLPEPFIGDPNASVYVLGLNPGYEPDHDDAWHGKPVYREAIIGGLSHRNAEYPFYFLDPRIETAPGSGWWRRRLKWLIAEFGIKSLARKLFCVELFPYHSRSWKTVPKTLSHNGLVPSAEYSAHLVRRAVATERPIVVMRGFPRWCRLIPELVACGKLFRLRSPQNVALSPGNVERYEQLVRDLRGR